MELYQSAVNGLITHSSLGLERERGVVRERERERGLCVGGGGRERERERFKALTEVACVNSKFRSVKGQSIISTEYKHQHVILLGFSLPINAKAYSECSGR